MKPTPLQHPASLLLGVCLSAVILLTVFSLFTTLPAQHGAGGRLGLPQAQPTRAEAVIPTPVQPSNAPDQSRSWPKGPVGLVRQHDFGAWSYTAIREESGLVTAEVQFNDNSVDGVRAFIAANRSLANQLAGSPDLVPFVLTFQTPLDYASYRAWATAAGLKRFDAVYLRGTVQGRAFQTGTFVSSSDPLPAKTYDDLVALTARQYDTPITMLGVFAFEGQAEAKLLPTLATDPQVFVLDLTANSVHADLREASVPYADYIHVRNGLDVFGATEKFGTAAHP